VAVAPGQPSQAAVARHFAKDVTLFDGGIALRTIYTTYPPAAVSLLSSCLAEAPGGGPLVAVAEGPQVSLWDVRGAGRGARVARLTTNSPHHGALHALAVADDGGAPLLGERPARLPFWLAACLPGCLPTLSVVSLCPADACLCLACLFSLGGMPR
jgi:hypothetical protein